MSLTDRLRRIEARLDALERGQAATVEMVETLTDLVDQDTAEAGPTVSLDGEQIGGERDTKQSLDD